MLVHPYTNHELAELASIIKLPNELGNLLGLLLENGGDPNEAFVKYAKRGLLLYPPNMGLSV